MDEKTSCCVVCIADNGVFHQGFWGFPETDRADHIAETVASATAQFKHSDFEVRIVPMADNSL